MRLSKLVAAAGLGLAALSASCVAQPGAMTEPPGMATLTATASPTAPASPESTGGDCYRASTGMKDYITNSVAKLSPMADLVAVGTVVAVSETRWATADGREPVRPEGRAPSVKDVYRLATFRLSRVGKTSPQAAALIAGRSEIIIRADGGQIGCKRFEIDDEPSFEVGQEIAAFFVIKPTNVLGASLPGDFAVMWPWWIYQGKVLVPLSLTRLTVDEFIAQSLPALP